jgi:hypothetical protein
MSYIIDNHSPFCCNHCCSGLQDKHCIYRMAFIPSQDNTKTNYQIAMPVMRYYSVFVNSTIQSVCVLTVMMSLKWSDNNNSYKIQNWRTGCHTPFGIFNNIGIAYGYNKIRGIQYKGQFLSVCGHQVTVCRKGTARNLAGQYTMHPDSGKYATDRNLFSNIALILALITGYLYNNRISLQQDISTIMLVLLLL